MLARNTCSPFLLNNITWTTTVVRVLIHPLKCQRAILCVISSFTFLNQTYWRHRNSVKVECEKLCMNRTVAVWIQVELITHWPRLSLRVSSKRQSLFEPDFLSCLEFHTVKYSLYLSHSHTQTSTVSFHDHAGMYNKLLDFRWTWLISRETKVRETLTRKKQASDFIHGGIQAHITFNTRWYVTV